MTYLSITDGTYRKYNDKYDMKSLLGITYKGLFLRIIIGFIISAYNIAIPNRLETTWILIIFIPVCIIIVSFILTILNGIIYLIGKIFGRHYETTTLAKRMNYVLGSIFPKKLYRRFHNGSFFQNSNITIYYGVLFIVIITMIFLLSLLIIYTPGIGKRINSNNDILHNIIKVDKYQYSVPVL